MYDLYPFTPLRPFNSEEGRSRLSMLSPPLANLLIESEPALLRHAAVLPICTRSGWVDLYALHTAVELDEVGEPIWQECFRGIPVSMAVDVANLLAWARAQFNGTSYTCVTAGQLRQLCHAA